MSRVSLFFVSLILCSSALAQAPAGPTAKSRGNAFNPEIGINSLFLYRNSNRGLDPNVEEPNGLGLQEAELQFSADVDPYWRFASTFSLHQEFDNSAAPAAPSRPYKFEPEEAYAESMDLPLAILKVGKFKTAFGRHNTLHTHAFPFIDAPVMNTRLLGSEGMNDTGVSAAVLLPTPWFSEVTLQGISGRAEGLDYFKSTSANSWAGVLHLKNLWDLSENLTFELGLSGATGENQDANSTNLYGSDFTFKWRPEGRADRALIWSTEVISREQNRSTFQERGKGLASWLQYQFSRRWWAQVRGEYFELKDQDPSLTAPLPEFERKQSALIGFLPSEFSGIRLQLDQLDDGAAHLQQRLLLQFNYSIGAHPAHAY